MPDNTGINEKGEDAAWAEYRENFSKLYDCSNYSSPMQAFAMCASHKLVEKAYGPDDYFRRVLEVGAGTGEHFQFVRHTYDEYTFSDIDGKTLEIARSKLEKAIPSARVSFEVQEGKDLNYSNDSFDRLIAVHVLEHIYQPHLVLKEWYRIVKHGGVLSVLIPTDPGLAWRLGRHLGPRGNALSMGVAYDYVMAREHVNSCVNLIAILRHYFPVAKESWWPLPFPSVDLNLFVAFHAIVKKDN